MEQRPIINHSIQRGLQVQVRTEDEVMGYQIEGINGTKVVLSKVTDRNVILTAEIEEFVRGGTAEGPRYWVTEVTRKRGRKRFSL